MVALVSALRTVSVADVQPEHEPKLGPEHLRLLEGCRGPIAVVDLAADLDLPLGVVRILIARTAGTWAGKRAPARFVRPRRHWNS